MTVGEAWYEGLPFFLRSSKDELWSTGIVPPGVSLINDPAGQGKLLVFTQGTTPTGTYRIVVTATEQLVTSSQDPFLQNVNVPEPTSQKLRLFYLVNVVLDSTQTQTPIPYVGETGGYNVANLTNSIIISPTGGGNGSVLAVNPVSGAQIDGRSVELTVLNNPGLGGGNPIPNTTGNQNPFTNGKLIDSNGTTYWLNAIFPDPGNPGTQVILRLDQEYNQALPTIINGSTYTLVKRDVYAQDQSSGNPIGALFQSVGTVNFSAADGFVHSSVIIDTRDEVVENDIFQQTTNTKHILSITNGGTKAFDNINQLAVWSADFSIINPSGAVQTIPANSVGILEGGSLVYQINLAGGSIEVGNLAVTITSAVGPLLSLAPVDLSLVKLGNTITISGQIAQITAIDNSNKTLTVSPNITATGSATVYRDSFAAGTAPSDLDSITLAVRKNNLIWFAPETNSNVTPTEAATNIGDDLDSLTYQASFRDSFPVAPTVGGTVNINSGFTDPSIYSSLYDYYRVSFDATRTVSTSGTVATLSGAPAFTVKVGDMLIAQGLAKRITVVTTQTNLTLESAFSSNLVAVACNVSQAVYTTDLNNYTGDGRAISSVFTGLIASVLVDYSDSSSLGDIVFSDGPTPNIAYTASSDGSTYSAVQTRQASFSSENFFLAFATSGTNLFIRFFSNATSGSGACNLIQYKAFFHRQANQDFTFVGDQAYCLTNAAGTPVNCSNPTVIGGKTTVLLAYTYTVNVNPGTANGQLELFLSGLKIPRFIDGTLTPGPYYTEVDAQTIALDTDYSGSADSLEILKPV